ncbi:MAG TPA: DNA polymerase III subunit alpha, partial [Acidimicrobiales bacterium]|nr:DNA polymerase III subunit alpha [Acidimicrobiales bacterium]
MSATGSSFAHLHTHTEYSMLDGAARIGDLVAAAVADGQPALGITDHGNMYGVLDFHTRCREAGINPIIGTEAYMAAESRHERPARRGRIDDTGGDVEGGQKLYYHLTLLAETTAGYHNLMKLSSEAFLSGYYHKPRCDWELLERFHHGLVATTGCLGGVVLQALLADDEERALKLTSRLQDIFGRDNLFVELQDHGLAEQRRTNPALVRIAREIGAPLLATNDSHYTHRSDAVAHDALLCVQTGARIDDPKRFKFEGEEHYLKTAFEMRSLFAELPEACDNTLTIAERAHVDIEFGLNALPQFPLPEEFTGATYEEGANRYLRHLAYEGARQRYGSPVPGGVTERLDYELGVIANIGFSAYFLVVWDLIRYARESGIRVGPGRGSAAGCCVAYCLRIVDLDPIRYDLLFERFLNPGRKQMPDIDMDFDERYRGEMIRYAAERYGSDHVAQIVTFSTIKAR